jgi:hypothetical protein
MFRMILPACLALLLACAPVPDTGYATGFGTSSGGYRVTFTDGGAGFAYWCTDAGTCRARARSACSDRFAMRAFDEIDRARSPDAERRDASTRTFWENTRTGLATLAVSCV